MRIRHFIALIVLPLSVPALAGEVVPYDLAVSRLRACITAGANGASRESLNDAVVAARSLCRPQINRVYAATDRRIGSENPRAGPDRLAKLRQQARRKVDYDLVVLVSRATGAQP